MNVRNGKFVGYESLKFPGLILEHTLFIRKLISAIKFQVHKLFQNAVELIYSNKLSFFEVYFETCYLSQVSKFTCS